jgi:hypothetical protein
MKIAIYGLPCAGKDALIHQLDFATHARLDDLRKQCKDSDDDIIAGGCYSFPSENGYRKVFTEWEADCFDVFAYLDTAPEIILQRISSASRDCPYRGLTAEDLEQWRNFEVSNLRSECLRMGKEFLILDPKFDCLAEFLKGAFDGSILTSPQISRLAADRILSSADKHTIVLSDGDKTLTDYDLTRSLDLPILFDLRDVFYGDRYTTFQFWYVYRVYGKLPQLDEKMREAADAAVFNSPLIDDLSKIDAYRVVVTAGLEILWSYAAERTGIFGMAIGTDKEATRNMSQFSKALLVRYLREAGHEVIALGDNMVDYQMLKEADHGYIISHVKRNPVVQRTIVNDRGLKQPASNKDPFDGVPVVKSIHEDVE